MATTTITLDEDVKRETIEILNSIGMTLSGYFNLAARQLCIKRRVPFEIEAPDPLPNEETRRAMIAAETRELGLIPDDTPGFTDANELVAFLDKLECEAVGPVTLVHMSDNGEWPAYVGRARWTTLREGTFELPGEEGDCPQHFTIRRLDIT